MAFEISEQLKSVSAAFDRLFAAKTEADTPGAAIALYQRGMTVLSGFSYANREQRLPVHPEQTVFRVGSLSKLLSALVILDLIDKNRIGLHDPINSYFHSFSLPIVGEPITVAHLLTSTEGLPERMFHTLTMMPQGERSLESVLKEAQIAPIIAPGKSITYDNWGATVSAFLVEQVTNQPFTQYVTDRLLLPLGMTQSSFTPPTVHAISYANDRGRLVPFPAIESISPAIDGFYTTAGDMLNLLTMLLNGGKFHEAQIISNSAIESMFVRRFTNHENLPGATFGLLQYALDNRSGFIADGGGMSIRSRLFLSPKDNAGFFVAFNAPADVLCESVTQSFVNNFAAAPVREVTPPANFHYRGDRFVGVYRYIDYERNNLGKVHALFHGNIQISNNFDGTLALLPLHNGDHQGNFDMKTKLTLIDDSLENSLIFQRLDNGQRIAFTENGNGLITALHSGAGNHASYQKVSLIDTPNIYVLLLVMAVLIFASGALIWTLGVAINVVVGNGSDWLIGVLGAIVSGLNLAWLTIAYPFVMEKQSGFPRYAFIQKLTGRERLILSFPPISAVLCVGLVIGSLLAFQYNYWTPEARGHYLILTVMAIVFAILQARWNVFWKRNWESNA